MTLETLEPLKACAFLEAALEREQDRARADGEFVLRAGEGAVVYVFIVAAVKEVVGGERQAEFVTDSPDCRGVKE